MSKRVAPSDPDSMKGIRYRLASAQAEMAELRLTETRASYIVAADFERTKREAFDRVTAILREFLPKHAAASIGVTTMDVGLERHEALIQEQLERLSAADDVPQESGTDAPTSDASRLE